MTDLSQQPDQTHQDVLSNPLAQPGIEALRKERERADGLQKQLKELQSKVQSGDILASELQQTKALLSDSEARSQKDLADARAMIEAKDKTLQQLKIEQEFIKSAASLKLNSSYQSLLLDANKSMFRVDDAGNILSTDGKTIDAWMTATRDKYPDLFEAPNISGTGATKSRGIGTNSKLIVSRENPNDFMKNLGAIADGSVTTE